MIFFEHWKKKFFSFEYIDIGRPVPNFWIGEHPFAFCSSKDTYVKDLVSLDKQMIRPAIVIPRLSTSSCLQGKPSMVDRFFLIDLKYIDRSGWPQLIGDDIKARLEMERETVIMGIEGGVASSRQDEEYAEGEDGEDMMEDEGSDDEEGAVVLLGEEGDLEEDDRDDEE